jgi:hypothetical protein
VRATYTMEDERRLFDLVIGTSVVNGGPREVAQESLRGSVELF